ncbi:hypothetical protein FLK61_41430 [Paenalkalicoccus suaedae]|uniref:Uncharacterized protein n=1 Tax=Paenalkalicoccus suaedae TaxID=2592382 RepID=A0A859FJS4_9BACI|nr:hypothetical protein [Paenalkalicoccus suaedae]QKS73055.1 hypothetical protein FLK61_41430 [Paenalkalicoccus suaedae]
MSFALLAIILLSLWSLTKTIEKSRDKILEEEREQTKLLKEIRDKLN